MESNKEIIKEMKEKINKKYHDFKEKFLNGHESYCEEMALMRCFSNFLDYIEEDYEGSQNIDFYILKENIERFVDDFLDIFWNSDLGNSYEDIQKILNELINEYHNIESEV